MNGASSHLQVVGKVHTERECGADIKEHAIVSYRRKSAGGNVQICRWRHAKRGQSMKMCENFLTAALEDLNPEELLPALHQKELLILECTPLHPLKSG